MSSSSIVAIATTPTVMQTLVPVCQHYEAVLWIPTQLQASATAWAATGLQYQTYIEPLRDVVGRLWATHQALIFGLATGAVVRLIAPLLQDKSQDPAVIVLDEAGKFVISLCGGHQAGGDLLAQEMAQLLQATPVLTGASNSLQLPGVDVMGTPFGWRRGSGNWTGVSAAVARAAPVQVIQEAGSELWQTHLPSHHPFQFGWSDPAKGNASPSVPPQARIWISPLQRQFAADTQMPKVQWHPRVLWVGIGCERGTSRQLIETAIEQVCRAHHLAVDAIAGIATLDLKGNEVGLVELCRERHWPLQCFSAEQLQAIPVPHPSEVVAQAVGTPSVAEAAAIQAAREHSNHCGDIQTPASGDSSLTPVPLANPENSGENGPASLLTPPVLRVEKQVVRQVGEPGAVTVAIAQAQREYTGRTGQLWLVGIGPGSLNQITPAASSALSQADAVIGYGLYIDLVRPLFRPGQIIEALPITQERQRAERAIELARWGLTVAVISSGDCGIYGMAGLVMETLQHQDWDGHIPEVEVFPGISALQAAAARVGAPLMHDFCAISLSDLLTPWEVIQQRLEAAAQADFVVALYNPKSKTRILQIERAQRIFLDHRDPKTPVALVRSAYRPEETLQLTTLETMLAAPIDMLTTVLIGNRSTAAYQGWMITPRGYIAGTRINESTISYS